MVNHKPVCVCVWVCVRACNCKCVWWHQTKKQRSPSYSEGYLKQRSERGCQTMRPSGSTEANKACAYVLVCEIAECRATDRKRKSRQMLILSRLVKGCALLFYYWRASHRCRVRGRWQTLNNCRLTHVMTNPPSVACVCFLFIFFFFFFFNNTSTHCYVQYIHERQRVLSWTDGDWHVQS